MATSPAPVPNPAVQGNVTLGRLRSAAGSPPPPAIPTAGASLAARAAARKAGKGSTVLNRVVDASGNVPSASAFQSAL
ncbi:hypothetical protein GCM10010326_01000 [Streptomyces xanthochromogenes]|uniref:Uncharacterized protein n=1 Tax=Streptomyces xanthochromogenes TaxID=67384 RepID=A0ABQ2ZHR7_9ACTN|nr:hypothetical protein GCM10010326_01000 [Streptomyces xanthochromogenes]